MENNEDDPINMMLKIDMRCKCSAKKIIQRVQGVEGVLNVKAAFEANETQTRQRESSVTTAVLNVENSCQCQGCLKKIRKCVSKFKGVENMFFDMANKLINVKGTMDVKALSETLANRIRKRVEILPPQKAKGKEKVTEVEEEECGKIKAAAYESSYGQVNHSGYGASSDGKGYEPFNYSFTYGKIPYEHTYEYWYRSSMPLLDAPQMFSEENPNACSLM